jgi:hypothetical protein
VLSKSVICTSNCKVKESTHTHTYTHIHTYTHAHTYKHTHTQTHTHVRIPSEQARARDESFGKKTLEDVHFQLKGVQASATKKEHETIKKEHEAVECQVRKRGVQEQGSTKCSTVV